MKYQMTVGELMVYLGNFDRNKPVLIANDEELNTIYDGFEIAELAGETPEAPTSVVIYGLDKFIIDKD